MNKGLVLLRLRNIITHKNLQLGHVNLPEVVIDGKASRSRDNERVSAYLQCLRDIHATGTRRIGSLLRDRKRFPTPLLLWTLLSPQHRQTPESRPPMFPVFPLSYEVIS